MVRSSLASGLTALMTQISVIHAAVYHLLVRQCRLRSSNDNQRQSGVKTTNKAPPWAAPPKAIKRLYELEPFFKYYNRICLVLYSFCVNKFLIMRLLELEALSDYQLIDCFILGRTRLIGRMNKLGPPFQAVFRAMFIIYRLYLTLKAPAAYNFSVLEFVLHDREEVLAYEILYKQQLRRKSSRHSRSRKSSAIARRENEPAKCSALRRLSSSFDKFVEQKRRLARQARQGASAEVARQQFCPTDAASSLFYVRNSFTTTTTRDGANQLDGLESDSSADASTLMSASSQRTRAGGEIQSSAWILRPCRSLKSWRILTNFGAIFLAASIGGLIWSASYALLTTTAAVSTEMGFEILYPVCVRFLKRHQEAEWARLNLTSGESSKNLLAYSSIYLAFNKSLACDADIDSSPIVQTFADDPKLIQVSLYAFLRLLADVVENYWFFADFTLYFCSQCYILFIQSIDVILNTFEISHQFNGVLTRLRRLHQTQGGDTVDDYHHHHHHHLSATTTSTTLLLMGHNQLTSLGLPTRSAVCDYRISEPVAKKCDKCHGDLLATDDDDDDDDDESEINIQDLPIRVTTSGHHLRTNESKQLTSDIMSLQSILIDHFKLIRGYHSFTAFYLMILLCTLIALTEVYIVLILSLNSSALQKEFFIGECAMVLSTIFIFSGASLIYLFNRQLYPLIVSAMALDSSQSVTKLRWITIMKHYFPTPLYCYTISDKIEISPLFCLKLVSWFFSAIVVLASFLHAYRS